MCNTNLLIYCFTHRIFSPFALRTAVFAVYLFLLFHSISAYRRHASCRSLSRPRSRSHTPALVRGMRDGVPIGLGYLAVAFSLGIAARNAGLNALSGFSGQPAQQRFRRRICGFHHHCADASYLEIAVVTLIANARYLLMSCSLSQKFAPGTPMRHRLLVGYDVTDELFGLAISCDGWLDPYYMYGAILVAAPSWAVGTALGVVVGNLLPARVVSAR